MAADGRHALGKAGNSDRAGAAHTRLLEVLIESITTVCPRPSQWMVRLLSALPFPEHHRPVESTVDSQVKESQIPDSQRGFLSPVEMTADELFICSHHNVPHEKTVGVLTNINDHAWPAVQPMDWHSDHVIAH